MMNLPHSIKPIPRDSWGHLKAVCHRRLRSSQLVFKRARENDGD